jgi:hypothetical protein
VRPLGADGMGEVYFARDLALGRLENDGCHRFRPGRRARAASDRSAEAATWKVSRWHAASTTKSWRLVVGRDVSSLYVSITFGNVAALLIGTVLAIVPLLALTVEQRALVVDGRQAGRRVCRRPLHHGTERIPSRCRGVRSAHRARCTSRMGRPGYWCRAPSS